MFKVIQQDKEFFILEYSYASKKWNRFPDSFSSEKEANSVISFLCGEENF